MTALAAAEEPATPAALFKQRCQPCHGPDGKGQTPVGKKLKIPDFTSQAVVDTSDADLAGTILSGKGDMPTFEKLGPEKIQGLVAYIRELQKKK